MDQISKDDYIVDHSSLWSTSHVLGHGKFGSVTLIGDSQLRCYAKKTYSIKHLNILQKELNIMLHFHNHPNIIGAKSSVVHFSNNLKGEKVCYIYMEYANKRTLEKMISEEFHGKSLPEYIIQCVARKILQGLEALHAKGYVHCNLNPSNILLCHSTNEEPFDLKIAGFGLSKEPNSDSLSGSSFVSMLEYRSPESCWRDEPDHDPADDIWSLGSIVHEMFGARRMRETFDDYYEWELVDDVSPVAKEFLFWCKAKQAYRATATELLNHPFITQKLSLRSPPLPTITRQFDYTMFLKLPGSIW